LRDRLGRNESALAGLGGIARNDALEVLAFVDIAQITANVLWMSLGPQTPAMLQARLGVFVCLAQHVGIEIAQRGWEQERRAVEIDHAVHGLLDRDRLRHLLFLDHLDVGELLERGGALRVRLVVAKIVAWPDIDEADGDRSCQRRSPRQACGGGCGTEQGHIGQQRTPARPVSMCHVRSPCWKRRGVGGCSVARGTALELAPSALCNTSAMPLGIVLILLGLPRPGWEI